MNHITLSTADGLEPGDCLAICYRLTKPGSEWQAEIRSVLEGAASSCTPVALWHGDGSLIGWACPHRWRDLPTLEQFTDENHRGRGIGTALAAVLIATGVIEQREAVAVFSEQTERIARRLELTPIRYARSGSDWAIA
jgi:GNAT superfamily N-acetyltransferase